MGRGKRPNASVRGASDFDAGESLKAFGEDLAFFKHAIVVGILEDHDAVGKSGIDFFGRFGIGIVFSDPESARGIPCHRDRLLDIRLGGSRSDRKTFGQSDRFDNLFGSHLGDGLLLAVVDLLCLEARCDSKDQPECGNENQADPKRGCSRSMHRKKPCIENNTS